MVQGGDILHGDGNGSVSIYGEYFEDENLEMNHSIGGFVGMANQGPDTNGCQFYITTVATPWLDGKHTIFGKVTSGKGKWTTKLKSLTCGKRLQVFLSFFHSGQEVVHKIERVKTTTDDEPFQAVILTECGEIKTEKPFWISDDPYDVWGWLRAAAIPLTMSFSILATFQYFIRKLDEVC